VTGLSTGANSRDSVAAAGWNCEANSFEELMPGSRRKPFSWLNPVPLWQSRNDRIARRLGDPTNETRQRWLRQLYPDGSPNRAVTAAGGPGRRSGT
jgi:hypothetical protein